ncbi:unnamed protein product [Merluccius merluccius]
MIPITTFMVCLYLDLPWIITEDMKDRISLAGDGRSFSNVSLSNLVAGDSGVYFCAAMHGVVSSSSAATKTYLHGGVGAKILVEDTIFYQDHRFDEWRRCQPDLHTHKAPGDNATVTCSHTLGVGLQMHRFHQRPGLAMRQMVYTPESNKRQGCSLGFTEDMFPVAKLDVHSGPLAVRDVVPRDAALYFCAVSTAPESQCCRARYLYGIILF